MAAAQIAQNVLTNATKPQEVILMHDIHPQSVAAVPAILKRVKKKRVMSLKLIMKKVTSQ